MKIDIKSLELINFKGIRNLKVDFNNDTTISGDNGTGKSTIFDAFTFLLFGKNQFDQKDFSVKTWDENGVIIPKLEHGVIGILHIDGREIKLSRTIKEKWVKSRGSEEAEFQGNETIYFINDVPKQQKEYQEYINGIIPEQTFKLLTNPYYYNSLPWATRREMLISIAGTPTDEEIAGTDLLTVLTKMRDEKKTIDDLKKEYAAKKKNLKDAISQIPSRIDEVTRNTPQRIDFLQVEKDIAEKTNELTSIDVKIKDASKGVEELVVKRSELIIKKSNLSTKIQSIELSAKHQSEQSENKLRQAIQETASSIDQLNRQIGNLEGEKQSATEKVATLKNANDQLRSKYNTINEQSFSWDGSSSCPTCGAPLHDDLVEEKINNAKTEFNSKKSKDIESINREGLSNKSNIERLEKDIQSIDENISGLRLQISQLESTLVELKNTPVETQSPESILALNSDYIALIAERDSIVIPEVSQPNTSELENKKHEISREISTLTTQLASKDQIAVMDKRKTDLLEEEKNLAGQISQLEGFEYQIEQFGKRKAKSLEERVNGLFPTVRFRMFNQQINGAEEPSCETLTNGVPWSDTNHAGQIKTGLEIISVFSYHHNLHVPVIIDNSESINNIPANGSQMIKLQVTKDKVLIVK